MLLCLCCNLVACCGAVICVLMWLHVNVVVCFSVCELTWYFSSSCVREIEMRWAIQANRVAVADIANTLHTLHTYSFNQLYYFP